MLPARTMQLTLWTMAAFAAAAGQTPSVTFTTYPVGSASTIVGALTPGSDGAVWFVEAGANKVGRITTAGMITEYVTPHTPSLLTAGPDGNLWFTSETARVIGRLTTAGAITEFNLPCAMSPSGQSVCGGPEAITAGPDGALWFTECCSNGMIGRITTDGVVTQYFVNLVEAYSITSGPDGAVWFLGWVNGGMTIKAGRITTSGQSTTYTVEPAQDICFPAPIIRGPDGNLWYGDPCYNLSIGEITPAGVLGQQYFPPSGNPRNGPAALAVGPDGAVWFPETNLYSGTPTHILGRVVPGGAITEYNVPVANISNSSITLGPDGALWFTDGGNTIIRAALGSALAITTISLPGGPAGTSYSANLTVAGGTPPFTWSIANGSLPAGLTLNSATGTISGTPLAPSNTTFTVQVMDSGSPRQSASQVLTISVTNPLSMFSIATSPGGLAITVDGISYTAPNNIPCAVASQHTLTVTSPQFVNGFAATRYAFTGWNDGTSTATRQINCLSASVTYTAVFKTQYLLTTTVSPPGAGTVTVSPSSSDGFYDSSATVQLAASANFLSWSGDLAGNTNPQSVIMNGPRSIAAFFAGGVGGLDFYPVPPCRVADTRPGAGFTGQFGPPTMAGGTSRTFTIPASSCAVPSTATAYSLNFTVVPSGPLGLLTTWPGGHLMPDVSTLNSPNGTVRANAAIVPAGFGGAIVVYVSDTTDVIIDINGYFAPPQPAGLQFFPVTPCRLVDTRVPSFPAGFGPPAMTANTARTFTIPSDAACTIPSSAQAYSLNITAVPQTTLGFLSIWPTGQPLPNVSTLNVYTAGTVVANAAIVPAGINGAINAYVTDATDLVIDINGYFAQSSNGLKFNPLPPCRVADTRVPSFPANLGPPAMAAGSQRSFPVPQGTCSVPIGAGAYSLNFTAVPHAPHLGIFITWPTGVGQPNVSTMNSYDGSVVSNAAIVPAGTAGAISIYVTDLTDVLFDISGYFAQ